MADLFFKDNSLYSHKNPSSIHQISNKYRYLCSQPSQQKGLHTKKAKQRLWIHQKHENARKSTGIAAFEVEETQAKT